MSHITMVKNILRNPYFDFLRGLAICMVVGIHTVPVLTFGESFLDDLQIIIRQMLNAGVPMFLAISGFFLAKKTIDKDNRREFWYKHISRIYFPCILWSLPLFIITIYRNSLSHLLIDFLNLILCGFSIYYFVALIIQYYILLPFLKFKIQTLIWAGVISAVSILCVNYLTKIVGLDLPILLYAGPFPVWILFFVLGWVLSCASMDYGLVSPAIICLIAIVAQYYEGRFIHNLCFGAGLGIKLTSFIYSGGIDNSFILQET